MAKPGKQPICLVSEVAFDEPIRHWPAGSPGRGPAVFDWPRQLRRRSDAAPPSLRLYAALAACACPYPRDRHRGRRGRTGCARGIDRRRCGARQARADPLSQRADQSRRIGGTNAAAPGNGARPGKACRRHDRDGRRHKPRCRARRGRVDRGRLRHPAGGGRDRACARSGPAAGVGRGSGQSRLRLGCRRYGGGRAGLGGSAPSGGARYRQQPRRRQFDGAARCDRRLRSGRRRLYLVEFDPGLAFSAQPVGRKRLQDPGKPHPRRDARCRRRVRHEVFSVSRANPGAVGGEKAGQAGQMDARSARTRS